MRISKWKSSFQKISSCHFNVIEIKMREFCFFFLFKLGECAFSSFCLWINDNYSKDDIDSNMFRTFVAFALAILAWQKNAH